MPAAIQYTIRGIPPEVDRTLRERARKSKLSLNRFLVRELTAVGGSPDRRYRSLKEVAGKWKDDSEFDRILAAQRKIDRHLWR